jgi:hypothetical protein
MLHAGPPAGNFISWYRYRSKKTGMSNSTEDNLGRRRFLLHRDKAVEHALERIRRSPAAGWDTLSSEERAGLREALSDIWDNCGRDHWEQYCFSTLSKLDILALIALVSDMRERHDPACGVKKDIETILLSCTRDRSLH